MCEIRCPFRICRAKISQNPEHGRCSGELRAKDLSARQIGSVRFIKNHSLSNALLIRGTSHPSLAALSRSGPCSGFRKLTTSTECIHQKLNRTRSTCHRSLDCWLISFGIRNICSGKKIGFLNAHIKTTGKYILKVTFLQERCHSHCDHFLWTKFPELFKY